MYELLFLPILFLILAYLTGYRLSLFNDTEEQRLSDVGVKKVLTIPFDEECISPNGTWCIPDTSLIMLRGKGYLRTNQKVKHKGQCKFEPYSLSMYLEDGGRKKTKNIALVPDIRDLLESQPDSWFFIVSWILPVEPHLSVVMIFRSRSGKAIVDGESLFSRFIEGTDTFRRDRFKFIPYIEKCPPLIRKGVSMLGGERPTLLAQKISSKFYRGENYIEVDVNIASSSMARGLSKMILPVMGKVSIIFAFTLEGRCDDELPEDLIGAISVANVEMDYIIKKLNYLEVLNHKLT